MPSGISTGEGGPAGLDRAPLKLPQATQSIDSQQTAPPTGSSRPEGAIPASARMPNSA
jgi:hypothetical protein